MGETQAMKSPKRLLPTIIIGTLIGGLLVINFCWGEGFIIFSVPGDAVYAIQPNGKKPTKLVEANFARPSPDGRLLAVWRQPQTFDIVSIATGQSIKEIPVEAPLHLDFVWSPDGRWIAYTGKVWERSEIFLISVQSGAIRQLTSHQKIKRRLVWAPDSRSIFYGETGAPRSKFWKMDIQKEGKPRAHDELFHENAGFLGMRGSFFNFSQEGDKIAYGSAKDKGGVYVTTANGKNHRKLTPKEDTYRTYHVAWSPDDRKIAFCSYYHETRTSVLYTVSLHNAKVQRLVEISGTFYGLAWVHSPVLAVEPAKKLSTTWGAIKQLSQ